ncbi:hypothetical protein BD413DRAFT_58218 [Trametes elegans]|nr:hypothetical protein BD413DRAFT_58218 [Trametes elegans]
MVRTHRYLCFEEGDNRMWVPVGPDAACPLRIAITHRAVPRHAVAVHSLLASGVALLRPPATASSGPRAARSPPQPEQCEHAGLSHACTPSSPRRVHCDLAPRRAGSPTLELSLPKFHTIV